VAVLLCAFLASSTTAQPDKCSEKCEAKREYQKARKHTPYNPIPAYIVECESHGYLRALNPSSGAGGRYQVIPSTWAASLPNRRFIRAAGGDHGPQMSS